MQVNVLARLKHPNVVKYVDCFMDANYLIIMMEYCNAGDLAAFIKQQAGQLLPEAHVMFLFVQVCSCDSCRTASVPTTYSRFSDLINHPEGKADRIQP